MDRCFYILLRISGFKENNEKFFCFLVFEFICMFLFIFICLSSVLYSKRFLVLVLKWGILVIDISKYFR